PPRTPAKAVRPGRRPLGVGEALERRRPCLEERLHVLVCALPDDGDPDVSLDEFLMTVAQLRDVPAAERSAVVPQEDQRERPAGPQRRQERRGVIEGVDLGVGRGIAGIWVHGREAYRTEVDQGNRVRTDTMDAS